MARSKNWRNHPFIFLEIVRDLCDAPEVSVEVPAEDLGKARSMALDFNSFKQGCIEAGFEQRCGYLKGEPMLWALPQLKVVVRDSPPRMVVSVKDYDQQTKNIREALAQRKAKIEGAGNG